VKVGLSTAGDLAAGAVVAVVLAPQGMAYALLAGLPPIVGLYAATLPLLVYALVGSSRHLSVGPVAIVSLLVHVACSKVAPSGTTAYLAAAVQLALLTGLLQLLLGTVRAGFMVNFLSRAAIGGFTGEPRPVLYVVIAAHEVGRLKRLVAEVDRTAFVAITPAQEVLGEGFAPMHKEGA